MRRIAPHKNTTERPSMYILTQTTYYCHRDVGTDLLPSAMDGSGIKWEPRTIPQIWYAVVTSNTALC